MEKVSRNLSGFMLAYCKELTNLQTTSLKKFFKATLNDCSRAAEPLMLFALSEGREEYLLRLSNGSSLFNKYSSFVEKYKQSGLSPEDFVRSLSPDDRFGKAAAAWVSETTQLERDRQTLLGVAKKINQVLNIKGISRAEACRELKIDKGNFYAFLKGDPSKLGRKTAIRAYRELQKI